MNEKQKRAEQIQNSADYWIRFAAVEIAKVEDEQTKRAFAALLAAITTVSEK